jgi:hypothetical protein
MKHRALAYAAVVLGIVAMASSFAEPVAVAQGSSGPTATITVTCQFPGALMVAYTYSGFSGPVRGVDFVVGIGGETVAAVKGKSGGAMQGFNKSNLGSQNWGAVSAQLLNQKGEVIAGSTVVWDNGNSYIC